MSNFLYWGFICSLLSADGEGKGGIVFSMATMLKMRATTTASAASPT
jgi:hypothetical protein